MSFWEYVANFISWLFVPPADYFTDKVTALNAALKACQNILCKSNFGTGRKTAKDKQICPTNQRWGIGRVDIFRGKRIGYASRRLECPKLLP